MIVAIDGPAGVGKSTTAREVARRLGLTYLDTGAMYRALTAVALERGTDVADEAAITQLARSLDIRFEQQGATVHTLADGADVTEVIRTPEVERHVSEVAAYPEVREAMVAAQRALGAAGGIVAEGRDMGTVVFPAAEVKIFLTASPKARAHRRALQRFGSAATPAQEQEILDALKQRDTIDSTREASPLKPAADAHIIDTSELSRAEVVDAICAYAGEVSA